MDRIYILKTPIDNLNMEETISAVVNSIETKINSHHVAVNAAKIVAMQTDTELRESVVNADIINADGQAVVWASKFLNQPLKERVAGIDLMDRLVRVSYEKGYKIFFLGATEEVINDVVKYYSKKYSNTIVAGYRNGYFSKQEERRVAEEISISNANILFVAISSPIKENFLYQNKDLLSRVNFTMGVGGSFDVVVGKVKRAPKWMQKFGIEWFYRVIQEPKRMWRRYLVGNTKFIYYVVRERFKMF